LISPDEIFMYFTLFPLMVILGICFLVFLVIMYVLWVPPEAKVCIKNKMKKCVMVFCQNEDGTARLGVNDSYAEAILVDKKTKDVNFIGRPILNQSIRKRLERDDLTKNEINDLIKDIRNMENTTLKPSIVKGIGCPLYFTYRSKAIAATLSTLVGLEYSGENKTVPVIIPIPKSQKLLKTINAQLKKTGKNVVNVALPVNPSLTQKWFPASYTQSQIRARDRMSEAIGRSDEKGYWKKVLAFCGVLVAILIVGMVCVMVLK